MKTTLLRQGLTIPLAVMATVAQSTDISQGKSKATACAGCHGADGIGLSDESPNLAGQKPGYLSYFLAWVC